MKDTTQPNRKHLEIATLVLLVFPFVNGFYNPLLADKPLLFWTLDILHFIVVPSSVAIFLFTQSGLRFDHIGLQWPKSITEWVKLSLHTIGFSLVFYVAANNLREFFANAYPSKPLFSYEWMIPAGITGSLLTTFYFGLTAGFVEEFLYRGLLVKLFTQYGASSYVTVVAVACVFAIVHWESGVDAMLAAFFISVVITAYYARFRLLFPVIMAHLIYDWAFLFQQR